MKKSIMLLFAVAISMLFFTPLTSGAEIQRVNIDIKPGSFPNSINPYNNGVIPIAVLTTEGFDATTIDPGTVRFGYMNTCPPILGDIHFEDVDHDGDLDAVFRFRMEECSFYSQITQMSLIGSTFSGVSFMGIDSVRVIKKTDSPP